jgi:hypothetical protein
MMSAAAYIQVRACKHLKINNSMVTEHSNVTLEVLTNLLPLQALFWLTFSYNVSSYPRRPFGRSCLELVSAAGSKKITNNNNPAEEQPKITKMINPAKHKEEEPS